MVRPWGYVFTINNYTADDLRAVERIAEGRDYAIIYGKEVGAQGTPHLQGLIYKPDSDTMRNERLKKLLGGRAWFEPAKDFYSAVGYCMKDGEFYGNIFEKDFDWITLEKAREEVSRLKELIPKGYWSLYVTLLGLWDSNGKEGIENYIYHHIEMRKLKII